MMNEEHKKIMKEISQDFMMNRTRFRNTLMSAEDFNATVAAAIKSSYNVSMVRNEFNARNVDNNVNRDNARSDATKVFCEEVVKKLLSAHSQDDYDKEHKDACKALWNVYDGYRYAAHENDNLDLFTVGNAQKWINMTIKFLYVTCGCKIDTDREIEELNDGIMNAAKFFHSPLDRNILGYIGEGQTIRWSRLNDYDEYMRLQDNVRDLAVKKGEFVIEWETRNWRG